MLSNSSQWVRSHGLPHTWVDTNAVTLFAGSLRLELSASLPRTCWSRYPHGWHQGVRGFLQGTWGTGGTGQESGTTRDDTSVVACGFLSVTTLPQLPDAVADVSNFFMTLHYAHSSAPWCQGPLERNNHNKKSAIKNTQWPSDCSRCISGCIINSPYCIPQPSPAAVPSTGPEVN